MVEVPGSPRLAKPPRAFGNPDPNRPDPFSPWGRVELCASFAKIVNTETAGRIDSGRPSRPLANRTAGTGRRGSAAPWGAGFSALL